MPEIATKTAISPRRIADLFVGAFEGGSSYWIYKTALVSPGDVAPDDPHKGPWYDNPRRFEDENLCIKIIVDDTEAEGPTDHLIGQEEIADGLRIMAEKYPHHFADIVSENDDANTADLFLQLIVFGEEVYA